jgi:Tol biopolymer transport system component/predicted Ser/Thr protein kinase
VRPGNAARIEMLTDSAPVRVSSALGLARVPLNRVLRDLLKLWYGPDHADGGDSTMTVPAGTRLGSYEVIAQIGVGGMGEVYRAIDTKLGRQVAIKTLPSELMQDTDRRARFEREAKLLAALNHPHIAAIYGLDEHEGTRFIAMELIEGVTLEATLRDDALSIDDGLRLALQIALALEAAHEKGVVHRDLKPANVMVTRDGQVKVLDFGLAKAFSGDPNRTNLAHSPALSLAMTEQGMILGTAAYMSPEQASGEATDQRTDIWAFGVVLFEMLSRRPLFSGESVPQILADVLRSEPEWNRLPKNLHPRLKTLLERCLQKRVRSRYHSMGDVRVDIETVLSDAQGVIVADTRATVRARSKVARIVSSVVLVLAGAAVAGIVGWTIRPKPVPATVDRWIHALPDNQAFRNLAWTVMALSPEGRRFVYNTTDGLYVRSMDELEARLIPGTEENLQNLFFSPDGQSVAYLANKQLKRIALSGGAPMLITAGLAKLDGASWGEGDTIFFSADTGMYRVSARGGTPERVIEARAGESFGSPELLPDRDTVLFSTAISSNRDAGQIVAQSLSTGERTVLIHGGRSAHYLPTGHLIYARGDGLFAIAFDLDTLTVSGGAVPLVQGVMRAANTDSANYGIAANGTLAYVRGTDRTARHSLIWVDRDGSEESINAPVRNYQYAQLSPDGTRVALDSRDEENDIWIFDLARETLQRLTFDPGANRAPVWSPDGKRVASSRALGNAEDIYWQVADGSGIAEPLTNNSSELKLPLFPSSFAPDGSALLFTAGDNDIWITSLDGTATSSAPLLDSAAREGSPALSPDGRWLAYQSTESGKEEIYVRPFPDTKTGRWQISTNGGSHPEWSPNGTELFYLELERTALDGGASTGAFMAVPIDAETSFTPGTPRKLFAGNFTVVGGQRLVYDVANNGQRFLMIKNAADSGQDSRNEIVIVENFVDELQRLVPVE